MKKLAVFVEGQTEQIFLKKLLIEIAGKKNIKIDVVRSTGPASSRNIQILEGSSSDSRYYALICDCGGDSTVKSDILETYDRLASQQYAKILGLRDVFPVSHQDVQRLKQELPKGLKQNPIPASIVLAIMEIEAWFLGENRHYLRIDHRLTQEFIQRERGIDITGNMLEELPHPASELNEIYKLIGRSYKKSKKRIDQITDNLDYENLYFSLPIRIKSLQEFVSHIDSFLS